MLPSKSSALFFVLPKATFGSLCAFQAAFHEHLKTAAFVDAVGLGLSNLVPFSAKKLIDGNRRVQKQLPSFETFVKSLEKWHFEAVLVVWSFAV